MACLRYGLEATALYRARDGGSQLAMLNRTCCTPEPGQAQNGVTGQPRTEHKRLVWCGVVWCGVVWCGVRCGAV
eukprot:6785197-Alexandrium_andersonii.AAC.1